MDELVVEKITDVKSLPGWFDIHKYKAASNLDAKGWHQQLFIRWFLDNIGQLEHGTSDIFDLIYQKPIIDINDNEKFEIIMRFHAPSNVHFFTLRELATHVSPQLINEAFNFLNQNHLNPSIPYGSVIDEPISNIREPKVTNNIIVSFDIRLPEQALLEQLQYFIRNAKSKELQEKRYHKLDFKRWYEYGILPYLDLRLWAKQNHKHIVTPVLTNAIYPNGNRFEENVKKTTVPTLESIFSEKGLMKLAAQI